MKRLQIIGLVAAILIVGMGLTVFKGNDEKPAESEQQASTSAVQNADIVKACDLLTIDEAKQLLGDSAVPGTNQDPTINEDIGISTCTYTNNAQVVSDIRITTVMVRTGLTEAGKESNKFTFEGGRPADTELVAGIGEAAYYTPSAGQLSVLKDGNWISVVFAGTEPQKATLADAKLLAEKVIN